MINQYRYLQKTHTAAASDRPFDAAKTVLNADIFSPKSVVVIHFPVVSMQIFRITRYVMSILPRCLEKPDFFFNFNASRCALMFLKHLFAVAGQKN